MTGLLKSAAFDLLAHPWFGRFLSLGGGPRCVVLMLHRFRSADGSVGGHDPAKLRHLLAGLRRSKIALIDVAQAITAMGDAGTRASLPRRSVAFTIDDGYADLVEIGEPVFAEFDCPVTGFVVPGVIDGECWFWWDQIDWIMRQTTASSLLLELQGHPVTLQWSDARSRHVEKNRLIERLKDIDHGALLAFVAELARVAEVPIAIAAPSRYRVLGWDELRAAEARGMRFGAHSMTHPILSQCTASQSAYEIGESVRRVRHELAHPRAIFCYPNGRSSDFGMREMAAVSAAGMTSALTTLPRVLCRRDAQMADPDWRFAVPRCGYVEHVGKLARLFLR